MLHIAQLICLCLILIWILIYTIIKITNYIVYYETFKWDYNYGQPILKDEHDYRYDFITTVIFKYKLFNIIPIYYPKKVYFKIIHHNDSSNNILGEDKVEYRNSIFGRYTIHHNHYIICNLKNKNIIYNPDNICKIKHAFLINYI